MRGVYKLRHFVYGPGLLPVGSPLAFWMSQKKPLKVGELAFCECPPGVGNLPHGLPRGAVVEVVGTQNGATLVKYYSRTFVVPTESVHSHSDPQAIKNSETGLWTKRSFEG